MAYFSDELDAKLKKAQSIEEIIGLLKAEGQDESLADRIWEELKKMRVDVGKELSLDELESVTGGRNREWFSEGCAATVEPGSSCWSSDGGCVWLDNTYVDGPIERACPYCGARYTSISTSNKTKYYLFRCRECKKQYFFDEDGAWEWRW